MSLESEFLKMLSCSDTQILNTWITGFQQSMSKAHIYECRSFLQKYFARCMSAFFGNTSLAWIHIRPEAIMLFAPGSKFFECILSMAEIPFWLDLQSFEILPKIIQNMLRENKTLETLPEIVFQPSLSNPAWMHTFTFYWMVIASFPSRNNSNTTFHNNLLTRTTQTTTTQTTTTQTTTTTNVTSSLAFTSSYQFFWKCVWNHFMPFILFRHPVQLQEAVKLELNNEKITPLQTLLRVIQFAWLDSKAIGQGDNAWHTRCDRTTLSCIFYFVQHLFAQPICQEFIRNATDCILPSSVQIILQPLKNFLERHLQIWKHTSKNVVMLIDMLEIWMFLIRPWRLLDRICDSLDQESVSLIRFYQKTLSTTTKTPSKGFIKLWTSEQQQQQESFHRSYNPILWRNYVHLNTSLYTNVFILIVQCLTRDTFLCPEFGSSQRQRLCNILSRCIEVLLQTKDDLQVETPSIFDSNAPEEWRRLIGLFQSQNWLRRQDPVIREELISLIKMKHPRILQQIEDHEQDIDIIQEELQKLFPNSIPPFIPSFEENKSVSQSREDLIRKGKEVCHGIDIIRLNPRPFCPLWSDYPHGEEIDAVLPALYSLTEIVNRKIFGVDVYGNALYEEQISVPPIINSINSINPTNSFWRNGLLLFRQYCFTMNIHCNFRFLANVRLWRIILFLVLPFYFIFKLLFDF